MMPKFKAKLIEKADLDNIEKLEKEVNYCYDEDLELKVVKNNIWDKKHICKVLSEKGTIGYLALDEELGPSPRGFGILQKTDDGFRLKKMSCINTETTEFLARHIMDRLKHKQVLETLASELEVEVSEDDESLKVWARFGAKPKILPNPSGPDSFLYKFKFNR